MQNKSVLYRNSLVHYSVAGAGPALMLVHGFGEDGRIWEKQVSELTGHFTLIIPDLPGSGKSAIIGAGTSKDHISIDNFAEILQLVTESENITKLIMIGHSMGGYISLAFAEKWPSLLTGFGLFHSSAFADNEEKIQTRLKAIDFISEKGSATFLKTATPNLFSKAFKEAHPNEVENFINLNSSFEANALTGYYYAMINRPARTDVLTQFQNPVLFIMGEEDSAIPLEASLKQCHLPIQSHVHILPSVGHMGMIEMPLETARYMIDFANHCIFQDH